MFGFSSKLFWGDKKPDRKTTYKPQFDFLEKRDLMSVLAGQVVGTATLTSADTAMISVSGLQAVTTGTPERGAQTQPTAAGLARINSLPDARVRAAALAAYQPDGYVSRNDWIDIFSQGSVGYTDLLTTATTSLKLLASSGDVAMPEHARNLAGKVLAQKPLGSLSPAQTLKHSVDDFFLGLNRPASTNAAYTYQQVNEPLWNVNPSRTDIDNSFQVGSGGVSWFLASLEEVVWRTPGDIKKMFIDNGDQTYTVGFRFLGRVDYVTVDNYLLHANGTSADYFYGAGTSAPWVHLLMKAYVQENGGGYYNASSGQMQPLVDSLKPGVNSYEAIEQRRLPDGSFPSVNPAWVFSKLSSGLQAYETDPAPVGGVNGGLHSNAISNAWNLGYYVALETQHTGTHELLGNDRWYALVNFVRHPSRGDLYTVTQDGKRLIEVGSSIMAKNFGRFVVTSSGIVQSASTSTAFVSATTIAALEFASTSSALVSTSAVAGSALVSAFTVASLAELRRDNGFHFQGSYYQNFGGMQEKWFVDRQGQWFVILPNGDIHRQQGGAVDSGELSARVDASVYANPTLLFEADVELAADKLAQLTDLRVQHGFHADGSYYENDYGAHEKWFKDRVGTWHFLTPDGLLHRWQVSIAASPVIAALDPMVYDDPGQLMKAAVTLDAGAKAQLSALQQQFGFVTPGSFSENWGGLHEKWFKDRTGGWFFLTPDGNLHKWAVSMAASPTVATISRLVFDEPSLLFTAPVSLSRVARDQVNQLNAQYGFKAASSYFVNYAGLGEKWIQDQAKQWYVILASGELHRWSGSTSLNAKTLVATLDVLVYDDPALLVTK